VQPNLLIHGDCRVALPKLAETLSGQARCAWIDPPYNTGNAKGRVFSYDDDRGERDWLELMRSASEGLRGLLRQDGSLFVQLDDNMLDRAKLLLDEVFGRRQFIARITVDARAPSAFSTVNKGLFKSSEYLLWYARDRESFRWNPQRVPRSPDRAYGLWLDNPSAPFEAWRFQPLGRVARERGQDPDSLRVQHAEQVCRLASISDTKSGQAIRELKARSKDQPERVFRLERPGLEDQYVLRGQQLLFYGKQVSLIDGQRCASRPLTNVWTDIAWEGIAGEGGVRYKLGKKPERLVRRCLQLATDPGDLVVDGFLGAGTTTAVAEKMRRAWIGIEQGPAIELAAERLDRVCSGQDDTGITKLEGYTGGGSYTRLTI
jgi:adenine-specific DNA-methyltransferase